MSVVSLNDLMAAHVESIYYTLITLGAYVTCLCMTMYICAKIVAQALAAQKVVVHVPVYDSSARLSQPVIASPFWHSVNFPQESLAKLNN